MTNKKYVRVGGKHGACDFFEVAKGQSYGVLTFQHGQTVRVISDRQASDLIDEKDLPKHVEAELTRVCLKADDLESRIQELQDELKEREDSTARFKEKYKQWLNT